MLAGGRHSGIGNRIPRFPVFCRETGRKSPFPDLAGKQGIPGSSCRRIRPPRERESGSRLGGSGPGISSGGGLTWAHNLSARLGLEVKEAPQTMILI
jgi:hypothetical protein